MDCYRIPDAKLYLVESAQDGINSFRRYVLATNPEQALHIALLDVPCLSTGGFASLSVMIVSPKVLLSEAVL